PPTPQALPLVAPPNDACAEAIALADGFVDGSTSGATDDGGATCGASDAAPDVWYSFTAASAGVVLWNTFGSAMDTVLSLHSACPDAGGDHELACSDDEGISLGSQVERQMTAGETVWVRVSGAAGASGSFRLTTDARPPGSVGGTVTKAGAGTPIAEAHVELFDDDGFFFGFRSTAADGGYLFAGLPAGTWFLTAFASSFQPEIWEDRTCARFFCDAEEEGDPVEVGTGLVDGIDFDLEPAGSLEGRVTDAESGDPVSSSVRVFDDQGSFLRSDGTDSTGLYRVTDLPPGTYTVATSTFFGQHGDELYDDLPCEPTCDVAAGTPVTVAAGSTTPGIDFALDRLGTIAGTLVGAADGQPISFEDVMILDHEGNFVAFDFTDGLGVYRVSLPPGTYFVRTATFGWIDELYDDLPCEPSCVVTAGTPVTVATATETTGIDFALDSFGRIAGEVTAAESGAPADALVEVYREDGSLVDSFFGFGAYDFGGLAPGLYFVRAEADVFGQDREDQLFAGLGCDPSCDVTLGTAVPVANSTVTGGIDFALGVCPFSSHLTVANLFLFGTQTREACRTIAVGANVAVAGSGELVLRAGRSVRFGDGFSVAAGGRLRVEIDPEVGVPE
ncbi:MAG TPA: carboxypeptidase-like regulatory domain-containing protein, partial [Thermoanaerobaculia bacterium]|nr:carboxypeptidase-like regulatory domain-containing protein [Thermoanaerobaculia bacterium]